jgi:hypothetical protein
MKKKEKIGKLKKKVIFFKKKHYIIHSVLCGGTMIPPHRLEYVLVRTVMVLINYTISTFQFTG